MGDESVDLFVTSPPYNLLNSTGNGFKFANSGAMWKTSKFHIANGHGYTDHQDDMIYGEYVQWQRRVLSEMIRTLKPDGAIFYNHKWRVQDGLLQDRREIVEGFPVRQVIIWARDGGMNFNERFFLPTYEVIYLICKPDFRLNNHYTMGDVWRVNSAKNNDHPAPFPIEIPRRCIQATDAKVVCDPFAGSGTTLMAARNLDRAYIGCDISLDYVEMARRRIAGKPMQAKLAAQSTIFEALEAG
jgi:modification methylase